MNSNQVPLSVPEENKKNYISNYNKITQNVGRLLLFAADQKIEHMNHDFYGPDLEEEINDPEHLFKIASKSKIGAFATQLGLISEYGMDYRNINYVIKLNSKTNLVPISQHDPKSILLYKFDELELFIKNSGISIVGLGYTLYLGSEYEALMLHEAARVVMNAHRLGLIAIIWAYPRGKAIKDERDPAIIAGAAGVACSLGADFVKINSPLNKSGVFDPKLLIEATKAAGRTKVICSGGNRRDKKEVLEDIYNQIHIGGCSGAAIGRNIFQNTLSDAIKFCDSLNAIVIDNKKVEQAISFLD